MTTATASDAKTLITLAERMGIPANEAIRQVSAIISELDRLKQTGAPQAS